jgi:hypothetical protein
MPNRLVAVAVAFGLLTGAAAACPVCDQPTGRAVRQGIADASLARIVAATTLPFAVLLGAVVALDRLEARRGNQR